MSVTTILTKENLIIELVYSGQDVQFGSEWISDEEPARPLIGPEILEIKISTPNKQSILLSEYIPKGLRFVGPISSGPVFNGETKCVCFGDLTKSGEVLALLHEMGHANTIERYHDKPEIDWRLKPVLKERSAWGWALLLFKDLRRQGINLEPNLDDVAIKELIKKRLLSYTAAESAQWGIDPEYQDKKRRFWTDPRFEDLDRAIDEFYDGPVAFPELNISRKDLKKQFGL